MQLPRLLFYMFGCLRVNSGYLHIYGACNIEGA
jgi:hypothetical protein